MPTPSAADSALAVAADATSDRLTNSRPLPEAALRALAEAAARRSERGKAGPAKSRAVNEIGGRGGLDPSRYGDWEVNGLASDF